MRDRVGLSAGAFLLSSLIYVFGMHQFEKIGAQLCCRPSCAWVWPSPSSAWTWVASTVP